jgi:uncharacterized protein YqeY
MLLAACKQREVDERIVLDDTAVVGIVDKLIKQRKDSITAFRRAAAPTWPTRKPPRSGAEVYLPQRLSADVAAEVAGLVAELGAAGPGDMGKVMAAAKARLAGKAEMAAVSAVEAGPVNEVAARHAMIEFQPPARPPSLPTTCAWRRSSTPGDMAEAARPASAASSTTGPTSKAGPTSRPMRDEAQPRAPPASRTASCR